MSEYIVFVLGSYINGVLHIPSFKVFSLFAFSTYKTLSTLLLTFIITLQLTGCNLPGFESQLNDLKGSITGNTYSCDFYTNSGEKFMTASGTNIDISENIVKESTYNSTDGWGYTETLSSVITITIDGNQMESCGSTIIFAEDGLEPNVDFTIDNINSHADGIVDNVFIAKTVNEYENYFGKSVVVVIQSQLGDPITAYSGDDVYWEVCQDIPKTTKLYIDGKALYIHRANFQIIDKDLL